MQSCRGHSCWEFDIVVQERRSVRRFDSLGGKLFGYSSSSIHTELHGWREELNLKNCVKRNFIRCVRIYVFISHLAGVPVSDRCSNRSMFSGWMMLESFEGASISRHASTNRNRSLWNLCCFTPRSKPSSFETTRRFRTSPTDVILFPSKHNTSKSKRSR